MADRQQVEYQDGPPAAAKEQPATARMHYLMLHRSGIVLAIYLVVLELIFVLFIVSSALLNFGAIGLFALAILSVIKLGLLILVIARWHSEFYEIRPGEVIHHHGVFRHRKETFACRDVREIAIVQGIWGQWLHFGTIRLVSPALGEPICLYDISYPNRHMEVLTELLGGLEERPIVFIRQHGVVE